MKYCTRCVMPDTKPDLFFDEHGVCVACRNFERVDEVDWESRAKEFQDILERNHRPGQYDCIVPVSGGKDSHAQVLKVLNLGFKPLLITASTDHLSEIGRKNIKNLQRMADYVEVTANTSVRNSIARIGLDMVGDGSYCEHMTIFTIPIREALNRGIRTLIWGENPQFLYGGPQEAADRHIMTYDWAPEFAGFLGLRKMDLVDMGFSESDLIQYTFPPKEELAKVGITSLFMGYFFKWDGWQNAKKAFTKGFNTYDGETPDILPNIKKVVEGTGANYENLDSCFTFPCHDYPMFLKYSYGRASAIFSLWIRNGRLTRDEGIKILRTAEGMFPEETLGVSLADILADLKLSREEFEKICDRFTNPLLFKKDKNGKFLKKDDGSPILENPIE